MTRYIKIYLSFVRFAFSKTLEFRFNFFFRVIMDLIYAVCLLLFFDIIFSHQDTLVGWNKEQTFVLAAGCLVLDAIAMTFFANGLNNFSELVQKGDLDYYLVRPVSPIFIITLREISLNSLLNLITNVGLLIYFLAQLSSPFSFWTLLLYIALLLLGSLLFYLTRLLFALPVFWTGTTQGLNTLFYNLYYVVDRPDTIFRGATRFIFITLLPFCLMASFPARAFFNPAEAVGITLHMLGVTALLSLILWLLWRRGQRAYSSASS